MDNTIKVAVVRSRSPSRRRRRGPRPDRRRSPADGVQDDPKPVVIPNLDNPAPALDLHPSRHPLGDRRRPSGSGGFARSRSRREPAGGKTTPATTSTGWAIARSSGTGRPAFLDLDRRGHDRAWSTIRWISLAASRSRCDLPRAVAASRCRVVLGDAKTHDLFRVGLGLANLAAVVHRDDRGLLGLGHGAGGGLLPAALRAARDLGILARLAGPGLAGPCGRSPAECGLPGPSGGGWSGRASRPSCLVALAAFADAARSA